MPRTIYSDVHRWKRNELVDQIISDLEGIRESVSAKEKYALQENIIFFEATKSLSSYIAWLTKRYRRIDGRRILELSDFPFKRDLWAKHLLSELIQIERRKPPDVLGPLRKEIISQIISLAYESSHPITILSLGCGAMEIERQIMASLRRKSLPNPIRIIGVDSSAAARELVKRNLQDHGNDFSILEPQISLSSHMASLTNDKLKVYFLSGDALDILTSLQGNKVDLIYFSKFTHHLPLSSRNSFEQLVAQHAKITVEFDDYRGFYLPLLSLLTNWHHPVLLNGAVFSSLRVPTKKNLHQKISEGENIKIFPLKGYLKIEHYD